MARLRQNWHLANLDCFIFNALVDVLLPQESVAATCRQSGLNPLKLKTGGVERPLSMPYFDALERK